MSTITPPLITVAPPRQGSAAIPKEAARSSVIGNWNAP